MVILNTSQQILVSLILIILTIILDRKFLKRSNKLPLILDELSEWKGPRENFIEFKKYQYQQVFWQSTFQLTFTIFLAGFILLFKDFVINLIGFFPWLIWISSSLYPWIKFSISIIPRASQNSIGNIKILLETDK